MFYGIKPDGGGVYESLECLEHKVKTVIRNQVKTFFSNFILAKLISICSISFLSGLYIIQSH